jgi:hypothetical protein
MHRLTQLIGKYRHYLLSVALIAIGLVLLYVPGRFGTDDANAVFVTLGGALAVAGLGWGFLRLDRQVSNDSRYRLRSPYVDDAPDEGDPPAQA